MRFGMRDILRDAASDAAAGGGGAALTMEQVTTAITAAAMKTKQELTTLLTTSLKPLEGLSTVLTTLNEGITGLKTEFEEVKTSAAAGKGKGKGADEGSAIPPEVAAQLKSLDAMVKKQGSDLVAEKTKREAADQEVIKSRKESALRTELNQFQFRSADAAEDAFNLTIGQVELGDDGKLVAGGLPLSDFVKDYVPTKKAHLLAPADKGGAGAGAGVGAQGRTAGFQIENIKTGMTPAETSAAAGAILAALPQRS